MTQPNNRKKLFNIAIALLIVFNCIQIYGIVTHTVTRTASAQTIQDDTTHNPIQINVLNGCGISGVGSKMTAFCRSSGYDVVEMGNYKSFNVEHSIVIDRNGKMEDAVRLAAVLGISKGNVIQQFSNDQMVAASVVIGKDFQSLTPWK
ncbi:MAG: LytR C-terminal domain-containing protein [Bacteriovoracaceae bacterium]|nr:LytR C-terminal domain-containing protein [Bacteroidota bacterium]